MPFKGGRRTSYDLRTVIREPDPISPESLDPIDETGLYVITTGDFDETTIKTIVRGTETQVREYCDRQNAGKFDYDPEWVYSDGPHEIEEI